MRTKSWGRKDLAELEARMKQRVAEVRKMEKPKTKGKNDN